MVLRMTGVLTAALLLAVVAQTPAAQAQTVDVTGAWDLTITTPDGSVLGLAILSQDDTKITGMIGPAVTDMFPVEGAWEGDKLIFPQSFGSLGRSPRFRNHRQTETVPFRLEWM